MTHAQIIINKLKVQALITINLCVCAIIMYNSSMSINNGLERKSIVHACIGYMFVIRRLTFAVISVVRSSNVLHLIIYGCSV